MLEGPGEQVQVEPAPALGVAAVGWWGELAGTGAVDRAAVHPHPVAQSGQGLGGDGIEGAAPGRAHVEQQVAALAHPVHEHPDQHVRRLVHGVVPVVTPAAVDRLAGLPGHQLTFTSHRAGRLVLLGGDQIAGDVQSVVDHDAGLQLTGQRHQLRGAPVVGTLGVMDLRMLVSRVGEVVEQVADLPVRRQQLPHLIMQVGPVASHLPPGVQLLEIRLIAEGVETVHDEVGMMPVDQRVVEADLDPLGPERLDELGHQVPSERGVGDLVVAVRRVPQAESLVVLGGQHGVLHARPPALPGPVGGVEEIGVEVLEVGVVHLGVDALAVLHPLVAAREGVQAEVDEHAEPVVHEARDVGRDDDVLGGRHDHTSPPGR